MRLSEKINGGSTSTFLNKLNESEDFNTSTKNTIDELVKQPNKFKYQMLDRLKSDCEYFLGNGNRNEKDLWADSVEEQIAIMKALWNSLEEKPEWLSMEDIENYEKEMADTTKGPEARKTVEDQLERNYNKVTKTGIEESENLKESTIRKFSTDSEEFKALSAFADELNKRSIESGSSVRYRVDDCYFDFGQNWWWTTVLATNGENGSITGTWQCLSPAQHEKIIQGNSDEVLEQVLASSDKLTK